ncbi:nuclease [Microbotryomycetes sp. JL221]|nr:nuclease [Microbotryomycetes sp. JL221]
MARAPLSNVVPRRVQSQIVRALAKSLLRRDMPASTIVHLGLAATAGIVLGAGAALSLRPQDASKQKQVTTLDSATRSTHSNEISGANAGLPTTNVTGKVDHGKPPVVLHGSLTGTELAKRVVNPSSIGPISDYLQRIAYTTAYDRRLRIPAWTAEHLTADKLSTRIGNRSESSFTEDQDVPPMFRAHLLDYFRSGYDRGHMVPAADAKVSQQAMQETFLLSNIAPQVGEGFNRHYWAYVEQFCRDLTKQFDDVFVFTIPMFLPRQHPDGKWRVTYEMIAPQNAAPTNNPDQKKKLTRFPNKNSVAVPTHFAKVILTTRAKRSLLHPTGGQLSQTPSPNLDKEYSIGAFVLPNEQIADETPLTRFVVPVEAVESSSGLSLFPDQLKGLAKPLCQSTKCAVVVRRFDDAQKKLGGQRQRSQTM